MNESTQSGDSPEVYNVDSAAAALLARRAESELPEEETLSTEQIEEDDAQPVETELEAESEGEAEPESTDATEEEAETFESLSELAEATGMELDEFLKTVKAKTKINGEESEKSLAEIIKGYQLESDYTRKNEAFLNEQKEWETQRQQAQAKLQQEFQRTGHAFQLAQQQLTHEFNAIDWNKLESEDSSEFLIQRQKFGERQAQLDQAINQATNQAQAVMQQQQAEQQQKLAQYTQQQDELLLKAIPEWQNQDVREKGAKEVTQFLLSNGYTPEEVGNIRDHRVILMARNAMKGQQVATDATIAEKKVKKAPKLVKPNARLSANQSKAKQTSKLVNKAKQTGRVDDIAAALLARRK